MALPTFYSPEIPEFGSSVELSAAESMHALQSRRLVVGTPIKLIDGGGIIANGEIQAANKRQVIVSIKDRVQAAPMAQKLTIAVAMPKGDRQKVMVDMLTQLGVSEIIPLRSERSIANLKENQIEKLRRVALEACKQSQNPWLPRISETQSLQSILSVSQSMFYACQQGNRNINQKQNLASVLILIGPEGGFSDNEEDLIAQKDAVPMALGRHILRTEAAAIAAAARVLV